MDGALISRDGPRRRRVGSNAVRHSGRNEDMRSRIGALIAAGVLLAGCQLSTMSRYDATTDKGVTALQRGIGRLFTKLETLAAESPALESLTESCRPAKFEASYRELQNDLRALIVRNEAREKNELTVRQLTGLRDSLTALQKLQQERYEPADPARRIAQPGDRCLDAAMVEASRGSLDQHIRAILKLELGKRDFRKGE